MKTFFTYLMFATFLLYSCGKSEETINPTRTNISESVFASGIIKAKGQYQAYANTSGVLRELLLNEGDLVQEGQVILEISNDATRLSRESAELARKYADKKEYELKLKDLEVTIQLAKSRYENDSLLLKRQENLWSQGIGKAIDLEQRQLAFENSKSLYRSSNLRYEDFKNEIAFNERNAGKNLAISQSYEQDLFLKSKLDGKIYALLVEKGEIVTPQTPLAIIGHADDFILEMQIDEYDIAKIKLGQRVLVQMDSYRGEIFEATLVKINPMLNERSKSFTVEAMFDNRPEILYPNLNFEANILIQTREDVLTIPRSYLLNESTVLDASGDTLRVETGLKNYQIVEIVNGITEQTKLKKPNP
ncbi:efflux RND transporter periplasmic adaptor subunit [Mongoliitalea daihaiensis]|uniref:efflux RND transporter periplasmic adaptor subunit n=1 Tax=Mongoliitalea daihaiensis TaxID=2782006 RepID=UPI001F2EAE7C|nr:efflux RND transporter periplasmic adaptor subunit [Mongoliitalea daihaiensis]UJP63643.1 efflux RND transporter periplasmic adaptor subunit [Mongoliitalea daihaiensis]